MRSVSFWQEKLDAAKMRRDLLKSVYVLAYMRFKALITLIRKRDSREYELIWRASGAEVKVPLDATKGDLKQRLRRTHATMARMRKQFRQLETTKIPYYESRIEALSERTIWHRVKRGE